MMIEHLDGLSFRDLGRIHRMSPTKAYRIVLNELKALPNNNKFTHKYCSKWSEVYIVDGKYISVKGYTKDIPILWGIDYKKHDIPVFILAKSEGLVSWLKFFEICRILNLNFELLVCDDNPSIKYAVKIKYRNISVQTCYNHFKEGLRKALRVRTEDTYKPFLKELEFLLSKKRSTEDFNAQLFRIYEYYKDDIVCLSIITDIEKRKKEFLAFQGYKQSPTTNNLIECFNSHLEDRVKSIRSFQSFEHARLWLNGYVLKRRYTKFSCCTGKFKKLNGKRPLDQTKKDGVDLPPLF